MLDLLLSVALNIGTVNYQDLEKYYWDCDTQFMQQTMSGQDLNTCLTITEEFQKHFASRESFIQYWNLNKKTQWARRGYRSGDKHQ